MPLSNCCSGFICSCCPAFCTVIRIQTYESEVEGGREGLNCLSLPLFLILVTQIRYYQPLFLSVCLDRSPFPAVNYQIARNGWMLILTKTETSEGDCNNGEKRRFIFKKILVLVTVELRNLIPLT